MTRKPKMTLMCGLPRSGKSTWVKKNSKNAVVVCPDDIRATIFGHEFFAPAENFVWAFAEAMAQLVLKQGKDVIIDACNITRFAREKWIRLAKTMDVKVEMVWYKTLLSECLKRNEKADRKVPEEIIRRMAAFFEDPVMYDIVGKREPMEYPVIELPRKFAGSNGIRKGPWAVNFYTDKEGVQNDNDKQRPKTKVQRPSGAR